MSSVGKTLGLFISQKEESKRVEKDNLILDEQGIIADKYYGKNIQRSILITSQFSYDLVAKNGIDVAYGELGENIVIDHNIYNLAMGSQISIGEVTLEITKQGTICKGLSKTHKDLPEILKSNRGVFAKVVKSGTINSGDFVNLKSENVS